MNLPLEFGPDFYTGQVRNFLAGAVASETSTYRHPPALHDVRFGTTTRLELHMCVGHESRTVAGG